jgi:hypothetical protein
MIIQTEEEVVPWLKQRLAQSGVDSKVTLSDNGRILAEGKAHNPDQISISINVFSQDAKYRGALSAALDSALIRPTICQRHFDERYGYDECPIRAIDGSQLGVFGSRDLATLAKHLEVKDAAKIYLVHDTNFLYRRYGSLVFSHLSRADSRFEIRTPRLAVLEIEALTHRDTKKESGWKRRAALAAFGELLRLQDRGAQLLPDIPSELLRPFSDIAGKGWGDAWIRREIHDFAKKILGAPSQCVVFVTSDLANALAAKAEGIWTLYLATTADQNESINLDSVAFARLIVALSVYLERVSFKTESPGKKEAYEIRGDWLGKTTLHWKDLAVVIDSSSF